MRHSNGQATGWQCSLVGSLLYEFDADADSGWGMGRSWRVLPYSRRAVPAQAEHGPPKKWNALTPAPSPRGPLRPRLVRRLSDV